MPLLARSPSWPLQKAVRSRLDTDLSNPVLDNVPPSQSKPYIVIGEDDLVAANAKDKSGWEVFFDIHVWSDYPGRKEAKEISDSVIQSLTGTDLDLSSDNFTAHPISVEEEDVGSVESDGRTREVVITFRVLIDDVT